MNENDVFPDIEELSSLSKDDPIIEAIKRLSKQNKIIWKKEIDITDHYYYTIVGEDPNTYKLEFQGNSLNIDQHSLILWRKNLNAEAASELRFVIRNNWRDHVATKRKEFQQLLSWMLEG